MTNRNKRARDQSLTYALCSRFCPPPLSPGQNPGIQIEDRDAVLRWILTLAFLDKTEHEPTCPVPCGMQPESSSGMGFVGSNWTTGTTALWGPLNHGPRGPHDLTNHWTMHMALLTHLSRRAGRPERADVSPASKSTQPFCNFRSPISATAWDQNGPWSSRTCCASPCLCT